MNLKNIMLNEENEPYKSCFHLSYRKLQENAVPILTTKTR